MESNALTDWPSDENDFETFWTERTFSIAVPI